MEMLEDVLLEEEEVMTEVTPQKYLYRRREEEVVLSDKDMMRINELVRNRKGDDRFIREGYLTVEESRYLLHEAINDVRIMLKQKQNAANIY
ncbi:MAG: hypothetical protein LBN27_09520 [Prevotellaceae bacterium]|jgi:hypothetical protein|nr:hypothetical protein [Prevotellaceae bacterium]